MHFKKVFLVLSSVFVVVTASEVFYNSFNNTPRLVSFYLILSKINSSQFFSSFLQNAIEVRLKSNSKRYSDFKYKNSDSELNPDEIETYSHDQREYLENELALALYNLSMAAYKDGKKDNMTDLLNKAIAVDPDLSFNYVELANYYFGIGDITIGHNILDRCINRIYPKTHCQDYLRNYNQTKEVIDVGFLYNEVNNYFNSIRYR